jgi:RimJ/RimL family protein N-acetyltransferase
VQRLPCRSWRQIGSSCATSSAATSRASTRSIATPRSGGTFPEGTLTRDETREELEWFLDGHPEHPELGLWATIHKPSGRFIGRCGLLPWTIDDRQEVEVAYLLAREFWGRGLATEAASAIVRYGFGRLALSRLICLIDPANQASIGVAERIGMSLEKQAEDEAGPFLVYSRGH